MNYPNFYDHIEKIRLYDPLGDVLGNFADGLVEYSFLDAVKLTGHGCPTVAGAYMICVHALKNLYDEGEIPIRGGVEVLIRGRENEGVNGVMGSVISLILGSSGPGGFKGLGGMYGRNNLLHFGQAQESQFLFKRLDSKRSVNINYHPESLSGDPRVSMLIKKVLINESNSSEKKLLHELWNLRVEKLLIHHQYDKNVYVCNVE
ncbi:MAG: hypothetical protein L6Q33_04515 [Bacteriovoracaceae bacterium]|nr:hypothetical protein [Bacteriovoracaceae bacterium]